MSLLYIRYVLFDVIQELRNDVAFAQEFHVFHLFRMLLQIVEVVESFYVKVLDLVLSFRPEIVNV